MSEAKKKPESAEADPGAPFLSHLFELRDRLGKSVIVVLIIFAALFSFANELYTFIAEPLIRNMPAGASMIATKPASPFLTPFKLAMVTSIFIAIPFLLYQLWAFIAPGLYKHERKLAFPLVFSSIILFYLGMVFAYYAVFPLVFSFLATTAPSGVTVMTDITEYLDFVLKLFFAFGIAFEVPIATIILILMGVTTPESLSTKRPYIIVGAFVVGMLLTPPDVVSQILLAVPMWLLFEMGLIFGRMLLKMRKQREEEERIIATEEEWREMNEAEMDDELEKAIAEEEALNSQDSDNPSGETKPGIGDEPKPEK